MLIAPFCGISDGYVGTRGDPVLRVDGEEYILVHLAIQLEQAGKDALQLRIAHLFQVAQHHRGTNLSTHSTCPLLFADLAYLLGDHGKLRGKQAGKTEAYSDIAAQVCLHVYGHIKGVAENQPLSAIFFVDAGKNVRG